MIVIMRLYIYTWCAVRHLHQVDVDKEVALTQKALRTVAAHGVVTCPVKNAFIHFRDGSAESDGGYGHEDRTHCTCEQHPS